MSEAVVTSKILADQAADPVPIDQLDLAFLAWDTPQFSADPYTPCEAARDHHPWLAKCNAGYVVHDLATIRELLVQDDKLRTSFDGIVNIMQAHGTAWGRFAEEQMIALPDKEHSKLRGLFAAKFTPRFATHLRPIMRETMVALLQEWLPKGAFDFEEFSSYYPVSVMARMIGAPVEAVPALRNAMEALGLAFSLNSDMLPTLNQAMEQFDTFAFDLIAERKANPRHGEETDLLDLLIEAGEDGISERQLADMIIFLFVAGYDTSKNVLTYTMNNLVFDPAIYKRCGEDYEYCGRMVEEALRMFTPASSFRATREDMVFKGVFIPKDTMIFFLLNIASRISADIEEPHNFDPDRPITAKMRHVGFGMGKHICLGQYIARAQLHEGFHLIAQHMHNPRHVGEIGWRPFPGNWGIDGLPIEFDPV